MDRLFPGLNDKLLAAGAVPGDVLADGRWYFEGDRLSPCARGLEGLLLSRPLLGCSWLSQWRMPFCILLHKEMYNLLPALADTGQFLVKRGNRKLAY
jgi:hypothetical protein